MTMDYGYRPPSRLARLGRCIADHQTKIGLIFLLTCTSFTVTVCVAAPAPRPFKLNMVQERSVDTLTQWDKPVGARR